MKILCIGDVVSRVGRDMLYRYIEEIKTSENIDLVIANGENATHGRGLARDAYKEMTDAGVDAITMGNHTWGAKDINAIMKYEGNVIRPINFPKNNPGKGYMLINTHSGKSVGIINAIGRTYMEPCDSPFEAVLSAVEELRKKTNMILVDFHAEATSEKEAMGYFLDGKVSAVFGTHTHVQTADEKILKNGTGYITDLGMTGPEYSVLGMSVKVVVDRFINSLPQKFEIAEGKGQFDGCICEIDEESGKCIGVKRIFIREN